VGHQLEEVGTTFSTENFQKKSDFLGTDFFFIFWARLGTRVEKSDFSQKSDFLGSGFLFHFLGTFGHGLRNPIFPKNRISWALSGWSGNFRFLALVCSRRFIA
jgi:hypothetical protein